MCIGADMSKNCIGKDVDNSGSRLCGEYLSIGVVWVQTPQTGPWIRCIHTIKINEVLGNIVVYLGEYDHLRTSPLAY